jgi:hypothetical protein
MRDLCWTQIGLTTKLALRPKRKGIWQVYFYQRLIGELHEPDNSPLRPAHYRHRGRRPKV